MTVGAGINFGLMFDNLSIIVGLTLGLMALKIAVLYVLAITFKLHGTDRWLFSLGLRKLVSLASYCYLLQFQVLLFLLI